MSYRLARIAFACLASFAISSTHAAAQELSELEVAIPRLMEAWNVPGLAIAVVENGEVVLSRGYGLKEFGRTGEVDANTLFAIGSVTKSFTGACLGFLVRDGTVDWDDTIVEHVPTFRLSDPAVTRLVTVRDFLSHRSGVAPDNLIFWGTELGRGEIVRRIRYREVSGFRESFQYNNLAYAALGEVIRAAGGSSWGDCVRDRIFDPLMMDRSTVRNLDFEGDLNVAAAHGEIDGAVRPQPRLDGENIAPAGAIYSSANDMARWLLFHLNDGVVDDVELLPESIVRELRAPQNLNRTPIYEAIEPGADFHTYGLGWSVHDFKGRLVVEHGGQTRGMTAHVGMMPEEGVGFVVLTNLRESWLPALIGYRIYETFIGGDPTTWDDHFEAVRRISNEQFGQLRLPTPTPNTEPSVDLEAYVGSYHDDYFGSALVRRQGDGLVVELEDLGHVGTLQHYHYDTFRVRWEAGDRSLIGLLVPLIDFDLGWDGVVSALSFGESRFARR